MTTTLMDQLYLAAAHAGFLVPCTWLRPDDEPQTHGVGFAAPAETLLDGLAAGTGYAITYPASVFRGLAARDAIECAGARFVVREVRALGDGSEMQARLARL